VKPAVVKPAVLKPAVLKPAVLKPAVLKPAVLKPAVVSSDAQLHGREAMRAQIAAAQAAPIAVRPSMKAIWLQP
jgi:hypothetical protein